MPDDTYIFNNGKKDESRLNLLNEICNKPSQQFLSCYLKKHKHLLEVGCGHGQMLLWLSKHYPTLNLTGIDISQEQIDIAKQNISKASNIRLLNQSILLHDTAEQYDFIYCRFVLMHLDTVNEALEKMLALLKSGGKLLIEEPILSKNFCYPDSEDYREFLNVFNKLAQKQGCDYDIGLKLKSMLSKLGLTNISMSLSQPLLSRQESKEIMIDSLRAVAEKAIGTDLIGANHMKQIMASLKNLTHDDEYIFALSLQVQISATK